MSRNWGVNSKGGERGENLARPHRARSSVAAQLRQMAIEALAVLLFILLLAEWFNIVRHAV